MAYARAASSAHQARNPPIVGAVGPFIGRHRVVDADTRRPSSDSEMTHLRQHDRDQFEGWCAALGEPADGGQRLVTEAAWPGLEHGEPAVVVGAMDAGPRPGNRVGEQDQPPGAAFSWLIGVVSKVCRLLSAVGSDRESSGVFHQRRGKDTSGGTEGGGSQPHRDEVCSSTPPRHGLWTSSWPPSSVHPGLIT